MNKWYWNSNSVKASIIILFNSADSSCAYSNILIGDIYVNVPADSIYATKPISAWKWIMVRGGDLTQSRDDNNKANRPWLVSIMYTLLHLRLQGEIYPHQS